MTWSPWASPHGLSDGKAKAVQKVVVYGAGGHGKVVADILEKRGDHEIVGFLDDDEALWGAEVYGYEVLGGADRLPDLFSYGVQNGIVAIGDNYTRARCVERLRDVGFELISAIHPTVVMARGARIGRGCSIMAYVHLSPEAVVGENSIICVNSNVSHSTVIGDFVLISGGVHFAGGVQVGDFTLIGVGAAIAPNVRIGRGVVIGAGASVISDIPDNATAVGVPAKVLER